MHPLIRRTSKAQPVALFRNPKHAASPSSIIRTAQIPLPYRQCTSANSLKMPTYIVTCKDDASDDQVAKTKQDAKDQGGEITHEYSLIKGFAVKFPEDKVSTLESHEHVKAVEKDQEVRTQ